MNKIKFSIKLFIATIGVLLLIQFPSYAATGRAKVSSLRIRETPSTDARVLEVLAEGDSVEILGEEGNWYKISAKGYTGYTSKEFIEPEGNVTTNQTQPNSNQSNSSSENGTQPDNNVADTNNENKNQNNNQGNNQDTENNNQNDNQNNNQNTENNTDANNQQSQNNVVANKICKVTDDAQIYILPILTSETIGSVKTGEEVTLINSAGLWSFIQTDSVKGWVRIDKLSSETVETSIGENNTQNTEVPEDNKENSQNTETNTQQQGQQQEQNQQQTTFTPKKMYVNVTAVNIRNASNTNADIIASATINTEISVQGEENGWYKIVINGSTGYIRKDLLSDTKTEVTTRTDEIDRTQLIEKVDEEKKTQTTTQTQTNNNASANNSTINDASANNVTTSNASDDSSITNNTSANAQQNTNNDTQTSTPKVTGNDIVQYAQQFVGYRYVYGAAGPNAFDCSGFTMYVYKHFGYSLSHSSRVQATQGKQVTGELQAGDLLIFKNGSQIGHVGIYIGNDKFIHASDSTTGVIISNLSDKWNISKYVGARRIL